MKFYRIENDKNEGPYHNSCETSLTLFLESFKDYDRNFYLRTRPSPYGERFVKFTDSKDRSDFIFGFSSKKKLIQWFTYSHEAEYFEKYNFKVSYYTSTEVFKSKYQSISKRENLTLIKRIDFIDN